MEDGTMKCPKCGGWMEFQEFTNVASEGMAWSFEGWRCLYCGEVIDPLILLNRQASKSAQEKHSLPGAGGRRH
jgi:hypothetical protein